MHYHPFLPMLLLHLQLLVMQTCLDTASCPLTLLTAGRCFLTAAALLQHSPFDGQENATPV